MLSHSLKGRVSRMTYIGTMVEPEPPERNARFKTSRMVIGCDPNTVTKRPNRITACAHYMHVVSTSLGTTLCIECTC